MTSLIWHLLQPFRVRRADAALARRLAERQRTYLIAADARRRLWTGQA